VPTMASRRGHSSFDVIGRLRDVAGGR
jgi:hypothetical protein